MARAARVTTILAVIAFAVGAVFLLPLARRTATFSDGSTWAGIVFVAIGIVLMIGARAGAGAEIGLRQRGLTTTAEVLAVEMTKRKQKGGTIDWWVARIRYRDQQGTVHETEIEDLNEDEREKLQRVRSVTVRYDPDHPDAFLWIDQ